MIRFQSNSALQCNGCCTQGFLIVKLFSFPDDHSIKKQNLEKY